MSMRHHPQVSVVVPLLNEAANLEELLRRTWLVLDRIGGQAEVLAVDDGSTDDTLERLKVERESQPRLKIISFSRNFGKEKALAAGLRRARARRCADGRRPPAPAGAD